MDLKPTAIIHKLLQQNVFLSYCSPDNVFFKAVISCYGLSVLRTKPSFTQGSLLPSAHPAKGHTGDVTHFQEAVRQGEQRLEFQPQSHVSVSGQSCPHSRDVLIPARCSQSSVLARALCPAEGGRGGSCCPRGSRKLCQGRTLDRSLTWSSCSLPCPCSTLCQQLFPLSCSKALQRHSQGGLPPVLLLSLPILEGLST